MPKYVGSRYEENEAIFMTYIRLMFSLGNELDMADAVEYMDLYQAHKLIGFMSIQ